MYVEVFASAREETLSRSRKAENRVRREKIRRFSTLCRESTHEAGNIISARRENFEITLLIRKDADELSSCFPRNIDRIYTRALSERLWKIS